MATSSINRNIEIETEEQAERLISAMEESKKFAMHRKSPFHMGFFWRMKHQLHGRYISLMLWYRRLRKQITKEGEPLKCIKCGSNEFDYIEEDYIEHVRCEFVQRCSKCGEHAGHWAYGTWNPSYYY